MKKELLKNRKNLLILLVIILALPLTVFVVQKVQQLRSGAAGQNASLTIPTALSTTVNGTVNVPIVLNTDSADIRGVDVSLSFDTTKLQVVGVTADAAAATSFKTFAPVNTSGAFDTNKVVTTANTSGKVEFGAVTFDWAGQAVTSPYNGTTQLATVQFRAVTAGTANVTFNMTPGNTTDTNIVQDSNPPIDLLTQASQVNGPLVITVGGTSISPTPTTVQPTLTSVPSLTPTRTPTPTTVQPTLTSVPSLTPVPNSTRLSFIVKLHGIGTGGDNVSPTSGGNTTPITPQRTVTVQIYKSLSNILATVQGVLTYRPATGDFAGTIDAGTTLTSSDYLVNIKADKYLLKVLPDLQTITVNQTNTMSAVTLVAGDSNGDGSLSILDYNVIIDCYSELLPARNCTDPAKKTSADLTDDNNVNSFDYNLFLRELSVQR